jgi:hypothetical protein
MNRPKVAIVVQAAHGGDVLEIVVINNAQQRINVKGICVELSDGSPLYPVDKWCSMNMPVNPGRRGSFQVPFSVVRKRKAQGHSRTMVRDVRVEDNDGNSHIGSIPDDIRHKING